YRFPEVTRQNLSDLLFFQDGLGMSSYRWNTGKGCFNASNPASTSQTFHVTRGVQVSADVQSLYCLTEQRSRVRWARLYPRNNTPAPLTSGGTSYDNQFVTM
ncbi:uncharacterized protein EV420DRAFT_1273023, partial [Desarmillaria tabescens]